MNYFEILEISETETKEDVITAAYQRTRIKWQTTLNQGIGNQQKRAREMLDGQLDTVYDTLIDATSRQRYIRNLKLAQEIGATAGSGQVKLNFTLNNGYADREFLVVENPVRHSLDTKDGLSIASFQEYICRAWEEPEQAVEQISNRILERWIYYAAGEQDISEAIKFLRWEPETTPTTQLLYITLDLLQTKYPAPILPRSMPDFIERLPQLREKPMWQSSPPVANFGLMSGWKKPLVISLFIKTWRKSPGKLQATVNHPSIKLDESKLNSHQQLDVTVDKDVLDRGQKIETTIKIQSEVFGNLDVPVFVARGNRLLGNSELQQSINDAAGKASMDKRGYREAMRFFKIAKQEDAVANAELLLIQEAYIRHNWHRVINLARGYLDTYGRKQIEVQLWLIEALRMVGGTLYQLGEKRRALEHLAALAYETALISDANALTDSWTTKPESQIFLNLDNPKADWVETAEEYDLNWTHEYGRADSSNYAGQVPIDLSTRRIVWHRAASPPIQPPLIAYQGTLVVRSKDNRQILGLDAASGRVLWQHTQGLSGSAIAKPVAGSGCAFVANPDGGLYALDIVTGQEQWHHQLDDNQDIALNFAHGLLSVGTGKQIIIFNAEDGEQIASTHEMQAKTWFRQKGLNPSNILFTDGCCVFQKIGSDNPSMMFLDLANDSSLEFEMPLSKSSSFFSSLFGGGSSEAITWTSLEGEVYMPYLVSMEMECRSRYRDSDGNIQVKKEYERWVELHFFVYNVRNQEIVAHTRDIASGTAYRENEHCSVYIKDIRLANACATGPAYSEKRGDTRYFSLHKPDKPLHRIIAAAFGRDIYYWVSTLQKVELIDHRYADNNVQAIAFLGLYDMVTTSNSISTSFIGEVTSDSTTFHFPENISAITGSPAIYGDVIFVTTGTGSVAAIGR